MSYYWIIQDNIKDEIGYDEFIATLKIPHSLRDSN